MTSLLCVMLALVAVAFTQLRADKVASARETANERHRQQDLLSEAARAVREQRGQAYISFLARFQRHCDELNRQGDRGAGRPLRDLDDVYAAFAEVQLYGAPRAAEDARALVDWLSAARINRQAQVETGGLTAFVEHAQQDLRLLAS